MNRKKERKKKKKKLLLLRVATVDSGKGSRKSSRRIVE